jgi:hypothetical protein
MYQQSTTADDVETVGYTGPKIDETLHATLLGDTVQRLYTPHGRDLQKGHHYLLRLYELPMTRRRTAMT